MPVLHARLASMGGAGWHCQALRTALQTTMYEVRAKYQPDLEQGAWGVDALTHFHDAEFLVLCIVQGHWAVSKPCSQQCLQVLFILMLELLGLSCACCMTGSMLIC